jgi:hypothetical protein
MEKMEIKKSPKIPSFYECKKCDYNTSNLKDYRKHCLTAKHLRKRIGNNMEIKKSPLGICTCGKTYKSLSGLWKHKKICPFYPKISPNISSDLILKVIEQNQELTNVILEQNKTMTKLFGNNQNNTQINNNHHSNNKTFNLNVFLNETCKDAIDIDEFVDSITMTLEDLEYTGQQGYSEGISNIIKKNLKRLSEYNRPIHCSDVKREVLYIKRNNIWHKEEDDKPILTRAIKNIANENIKQIAKWREEHPDCINAESKKNNMYLKIVSNSMSGIDTEETTRNLNKIMSNVLKEVAINKNNH